MKRIVFVVDHIHSDQAGTENQLIKLIRGLAPQFDIELVAFRDSEWVRTKAALPCRVKIFQIDKFTRFYTYCNLFRFLRYLRASRPHLVHTFFPVANILGVLCARAAGVPVVIASRRDYGEWMSARYLYATRVANLFVTSIIANAPQVKRLTERVEKFPAARIEVIYNGIAAEKFGATPKASADAIKRALGIPESHKVVGLVANYRPMKRHETLVRAAREILNARDDVSFLFLGRNVSGVDLQKKTVDLAVALGISHRVYFAHADGNIRQYLALFDVGVNCSEGEGLSNAIMEYMAAGVPCVVAASGGNPDLVTDDVTGYTFPLDDHAVLARKILHLLGDARARARLATNALVRVRSEMSLEAMLGRFARYYTGLIESSGARLPDAPAKPTETRVETRL